MEATAASDHYLALLEDRRRDLRTQLVHTLPPRGSFVWELGCGHGHFLTSYAQANPEKWCVGIDFCRERIGRALRKRDRARLTNLHFLHTEAKLFLECLPVETTLAALFVLFPDPWPKLRHHKHRIMKPVFLDALATHAAPDCLLSFRTDFAPYFEEAKTMIDAHARWRRVDEAWSFESETVFQNRAHSHQSLLARLRSLAAR